MLRSFALTPLRLLGIVAAAWLASSVALADQTAGSGAIPDVTASSPLDAAPTAPPYSFFPMAGTFGQDVSVEGYVDLGDGQTPRDFACTAYTRVDHRGHDASVPGFREQAIGVPVFAALDGTVVAAHDGELDQNVTNLVGRPANFVTLSHAGGYRTNYVHFKQGSVAVSVGQSVRAGTQLGLTGSSGNSSWPHLHFESQYNFVPFEPFAGPCRPGPSYWVAQPPFRRDVYLTSFTYGTAPFSGNAGYPYDEVARRGTYQMGPTSVYFRLMTRNLPPQSTYRFVILRPDGTTASDSTSVINSTASPIPRSWSWFFRTVSLTMTGSWSMDVYVNGERVAIAPFTVVSTAAEIVNRPPLAIQSLALDPPAPTSFDVPFCRVTPTTLYRRDPDYDLVRYRYRWEINGVAIRDVITAALSDAIPRGLLGQGDRLTCFVTPLDDSAAGPTTSVSSASPGTFGPPAGLTGSSTGSSVLLSWRAPALGGTPATYVIEAGSSSGLTNLASFATGTAATTFSATEVPPGTYFVRVRAGNPAAPGPPSNEVMLVVGAPGAAPCTSAPAAPTGLSVSSVNGGTVVLIWNGAAGSPMSYLIEVGWSPGASDLMNSDLRSVATTLTATGVGRGSYYVRIRGSNGCGVGPASNEVALIVS